jgi:hypothetical protein
MILVDTQLLVVDHDRAVAQPKRAREWLGDP